MFRSTLRTCSSFALLAWLTCPRHVAAQTPPSEPDASVANEAKQEFEHGEHAFAAGDYARALRHFQNADRLATHVSARFNIAVCLEKLGRIREALELYRALSQSSEIDFKAKNEAEERAARAESALATLELQGPRGSEVSVDDRDRCLAPCTLTVNPGDHRVRFGVTRTPIDVSVSSGEVLRVSAPATPVRAPRKEARRIPEEPPSSERFGPLSWIGAGAFVVGGGMFLYYGLRTDRLHEEYKSEPNPDTRDRGIRARTTANIALGIALVGAAVVVVDWATSSGGHGARRATPRRDVGSARSFDGILASD
jgi:hypothetical protein